MFVAKRTFSIFLPVVIDECKMILNYFVVILKYQCTSSDEISNVTTPLLSINTHTCVYMNTFMSLVLWQQKGSCHIGYGSNNKLSCGNVVKH